MASNRFLAGVLTGLALAAVGFGAYRLHSAPEPPSARATGASPGGASLSPTEAARLMDRGPAATAGMAPATSSPPGTAAAPSAPASSMESAITSLEARLAKGGGKPDDWELLAKSFEFLGRPADAARARAHQLPSVGDAPSTAAAAAGGVTVSGEVTLDPSLGGKARTGETLFIVAKSVDSPGAPVAVIRRSVGSWPVSFRIDDTLSMMPGRTLSTAGRVTVEARISHNGQPTPSAGDLQGSSGPIDPAAHKPLSIRIDQVIP